MKTRSVISLFLSILMILGTLSVFTFTASAAGKTLAGFDGYEFMAATVGADLYVNKETGELVFAAGSTPLFQPTEEELAEAAKAAEEEEEPVFDYETYYTTKYSCPQELVAKTMTFQYEKGDYAIFMDERTAITAFLQKSTGQILLTNPYDVGTSTSTTAIKDKLLSQFTFTYTKSSSANNYSTFGQAAVNDQIAISRIRGGVRVDYTVGRQEARVLVPRMIEKNAFETKILSKITLENAAPGKTEAQVKRDYNKVTAYYTLKDVEAASSTKARNSLILTYPIAKKYAFYLYDSAAGTREKYEMESIIKEYTDYTYEELQADHELVEYEGAESSPPLFKMALEYYLDDNGIKVRVPAKSISYDKNSYTITELHILPYLGAGSQEETGYTYYPDGSGTIVRFEDIGNTTKVISGKMYGQDYSYHTTSGQNKETMRIPAFGVKRDEEYVVATSVETMQVEKVVEGTISYDEKQVYHGEKIEHATGYVAYMEEGDSLVQISTDHGGVTHKYHSTYATVFPQLSDTYALTGISTTGGASYTQNVKRGYTGNYTFRLFMVEDEEADYVGMAQAIRKYLLDTGALTEIAEDDKNIPLILENFGSVKTSQKVMGIPVTENTKLTTFEQCEAMVEELRAAGVSNIDVKYTGWYNGGMEHGVTSKIKVQKALGGEDALKQLASFAEANNVGLYPDLEFTYVSHDGLFDGYNYKTDAVKTINNKAASHRLYSGLYQGFEDDDMLVTTPESITRLYNKVSDTFLSFGTTGLSVASLGSDLSSDHDKENILTREEAKDVIKGLLADMKEQNGSVMVSGGNAYTFAYADIITDLPLDSSRNVYASEAIPFLGIVLHGCVEYAGTAINLDGDFDYSVLKCIENGASPYFILSYTDDDVDNTSELKSFEQFSKYYSIKYGIWKEDLISTYEKLNDALAGVKKCTISDHEYVDTRVVKVSYSNGTSFVLNYNSEAYTYEGKEIPALGFIKL